jgi:hypothetical protein
MKDLFVITPVSESQILQEQAGSGAGAGIGNATGRAAAQRRATKFAQCPMTR